MKNEAYPKIHVTSNSKEVRSGSIFFALKGSRFDGHDFIAEAFQAGASKVYAEYDVHDPRVVVLGNYARKKLAELAGEMYGNPTHALKMVGVTGTSGKTTTSYLIQHLLNSEARCARMGTNGAEFEGKNWPTPNTTPDALTLQKWFREVLDLGATHVVMEVSSHALDQDRAWGIAWDVTVFLNLSPEHMDYHPTLDHYFGAKSLLLTDHLEYSRSIGKSPLGWVNEDTAYGKKILAKDTRLQAFSVHREVRNLNHSSEGIRAEVEWEDDWKFFKCPLFGKFQMENILAALKTAESMGIFHPWEKLADFPGVPGRMESIPNSKGILVFVDYAHKPEALEKVLQSIQGKRIITVFGCGGDRDRTKRPVMGEIATRLSHHTVITSDNPRTEDPLQILREIEAGPAQKKRTNYEIIPDREEAIKKAITLAENGDLVLIAGKGHESDQILSDGKGGTRKIHFDDREVVRKYL